MSKYKEQEKERLLKRKLEEERLQSIHKPDYKVGELVNLINQVAEFKEEWVFRVVKIEPVFYGRMPKLTIGYHYMLGEWSVIHDTPRGYGYSSLKRASDQNIRISKSNSISALLKDKFKYIPFSLKEKFYSDNSYTLKKFKEDVEKYLEERFLPQNYSLSQNIEFISKFYKRYYAQYLIHHQITEPTYKYKEQEEAYPIVKQCIKKLGFDPTTLGIHYQENILTCPTEELIHLKQKLKFKLRAEMEEIASEENKYKGVKEVKPTIKRYKERKLKKVIEPLEERINHINGILQSRPQAIAQLNVLL